MSSKLTNTECSLANVIKVLKQSKHQFAQIFPFFLFPFWFLPASEGNSHCTSAISAVYLLNAPLCLPTHLLVCLPAVQSWDDSFHWVYQNLSHKQPLLKFEKALVKEELRPKHCTNKEERKMLSTEGDDGNNLWTDH